MNDFPERDPLISVSEKEFILQSRVYNEKQHEKDVKLPLLPLLWDILRNRAVLADMLSLICSDMGMQTVLIEGPDFLSKILPLGKDIASNGLYSALPCVVMAVVTPTTGAISDYAIAKGVLSRLNSQRLCFGIGSLIPAAGMIGATFLTGEATQGWKFMSCNYCPELAQQASWLLIGCTRVNNQSEARSGR